MPELSAHHLEAAFRVALSLWNLWKQQTPAESRGARHKDYVRQMQTTWWGGIPGYPRAADGTLTPTDQLAGHVLPTVYQRGLSTRFMNF